jgi:ribose 5-phosphate isomerase B
MIALGSDHAGYLLKEKIKAHLLEQGLTVEDFGSHSQDPVDYPLFALEVARAVAAGKTEFGILCCGTGIGVSMAANKVPGVRAACCTNAFMAEATRLHNNANVLTLGSRVLEETEALALADLFLRTPFSGEARHQARVNQLAAIERGEL